MIAFFLRGVPECAQEGQNWTDDPLTVRECYHAAVRSARSSGLLSTLISDPSRLPSITIGRTTELLGVTPAAASSNLRKPQALRIVSEVTGRIRCQVFVARENLTVVGRDPAAPTPPGTAGRTD